MTTFVQGDTLPIIRGTIVLRGTTTVVPLTDVESVSFQMRKSDDREFQVDAEADVTDAPGGKVAYSWAPNDLAIPGTYQCQWRFVFAGGYAQTTDVREIEVRRA